jgi:membrane-associated phospholipid phosphatase
VLIFLGATGVFLALAALVAVKGDDLPWFDDVIFRFAERIQQQQVNSFVRFIGRLGGTEVVFPIGVTVAGIGSLSPLAIVLLAYAFAAWWTLRFKHLIERHEPFDHPTDLGLSFPSGHMSQSVSVYVVLLVLVGGYERHRLFRVLIALGMLIVFVAVEYRSTHWTTDTIGGAALGVAGACFGILVVRGIERLPGLRDILSRA